MARVARVVVPIDFDGARSATVEINRDALLFTVRLYRRRRTYTLPLSMVAQVVAWKVTKASSSPVASRRVVSRVSARVDARWPSQAIAVPAATGDSAGPGLSRCCWAPPALYAAIAVPGELSPRGRVSPLHLASLACRLSTLLLVRVAHVALTQRPARWRLHTGEAARAARGLARAALTPPQTVEMPMPRLQLAVVQYVVVDVPERCPRCSASFVDGMKPSLREVALAESVFLGSLYLDGTEQHFDVADGREASASGFHPVAYQCDRCEVVVAG